MSQEPPRKKSAFTGPSHEFKPQFKNGKLLEVYQPLFRPEIFIDVASLRMAIEGKNVGDDLKGIAASHLKTLEGLSAEINTIPSDAVFTEATGASLAETTFQELNSWLQNFTNDEIMNRIPYCEGEYKITLECIYKGFQLIACAVHCLRAMLAMLIMQQKFDQEVLVPLASKKRFESKELTELMQHANCIVDQGVNDAKSFRLILSEGSSELGIIDTTGKKVPLSKFMRSMDEWIKRHCTPPPDELKQNFNTVKTISQTFQQKFNQAFAKQKELVAMISDYIHNTSVETAGDDNFEDNSENDSEKNLGNGRLEGAGEGPKDPAPPNESMNAGGSSDNAVSDDVIIILD